MYLILTLSFAILFVIGYSVTGEVTIVRRKRLTNSHALTIQERAATNADQNRDFAIKMDKILGVIQGYEGKTDTTMELMLDMQKSFEEKVEALREENGEIKA